MADKSPSESYPLPLATDFLKDGTKAFFFDLFENDRGRYLRITERSKSQGRKTWLLIPESALPEFSRTVEAMASFTKKLPPTGK